MQLFPSETQQTRFRGSMGCPGLSSTSSLLPGSRSRDVQSALVPRTLPKVLPGLQVLSQGTKAGDGQGREVPRG